MLGHGGFGITYKAVDTLLQETVAIKEYLPNELAVRAATATVQAKSGSDQVDFEEGLKTFLEEARVMARFRHPRIVHVRRFFEMHGTGYIVLDYERGQTLSERLNEGPVSEDELRVILSGVLDGLEVLHEGAILHRDLKPNNIMLCEDGAPVLIDFGAARDFRSRHSRSVTAIATPGYSPPEQYGAGGQQGPWSDLYALGAIAYRCVTGKVPPDSLRRLRNDPLVPASVAAAGQYDEALLRTIDWMLRIDEMERPASVEAVREALRGGAIPDADQRPRSVTVTVAEPGHNVLEFDRDTAADVLDLAFLVTPPGRYLLPSQAGQATWGQSAHYFSVFRASDAEGRARFTAGPEISNYIPDKAEVTIASRDGYVQGSAVWPGNAVASKKPRGDLRRLRWRRCCCWGSVRRRSAGTWFTSGSN